MKLEESVTVIKGIGEKAQQNLAKLGIFTVNDLITHYPRDYRVFEYPLTISQAANEKNCAFEASICSRIDISRNPRRTIIKCKIKDMTGAISAVWYNQPYLKNTLKPGTRYVFRGKCVWRPLGLTIEQPQIYDTMEYRRLLNVLQPMYPLTDGITNNAISKAMDRALNLVEFPEEYLDKNVIRENGLMRRQDALREIHFPKSRENMLEARRRIVFDEFYSFAVAMRQLKADKGIRMNSFSFSDSKMCDQLVKELPYQLTGAQSRVWMQIKNDMLGQKVMNRLVQGDVGSGKTILAVLALLLCAANGYQGCMMVPTEVLAKQHYRTLSSMLSEYGVKVELLTGSMTAAEKREAYARIKSHQSDIIIGTHALIQDKVVYDKLALVITDEQHRFGVRQREKLASKGTEPHMLVMSATPIPRTLAIILYGDLDLSVIDELPANRMPIKNCVVGTEYREKAYGFIAKQAAEGHQSFVICPMVEESEQTEAENVIDYTEELREHLPEGISVEYLHGRMKPAEKNKIMEMFADGEITVLVSTTVVEVGIDVPNATVMLIENADRFGLAQLHQLRGRVGRGNAQAYCIMIGSSSEQDKEKRLDIMAKSNDGFVIAEEDLKLRGPGDMFGIKQSGDLEFKMGDIYSDAALLKAAVDAADKIPEEKMCVGITQVTL